MSIFPRGPEGVGDDPSTHASLVPGVIISRYTRITGRPSSV